jgi:hypothetical protein
LHADIIGLIIFSKPRLWAQPSTLLNLSRGGLKLPTHNRQNETELVATSMSHILLDIVFAFVSIE